MQNKKTNQCFVWFKKKQRIRTDTQKPCWNKFNNPLRLPNLKPRITKGAKGSQRLSFDDTGNTNVETCNLVSRSESILCIKAATTTVNDRNTRLEKRKVADLGKQELALNGMEDQWRFLESQDLGNYAINYLLLNNRRVRRRSTYSSKQRTF
ncbi:hypothetical protein AYI69_g9687 [Smittium culicis]|uniref:Uncharacterized protein n=1 Tax=Smittium culicis TaxID=133412 RepID=A0A1R1XB24_9FUNG|nr:hypothetical protein AYI69_g9687 [Smittium culicis]